MTGYAEVALLYMERGLLPLPVKGKRPPVAGSTGRSGSVTEEQVAMWCRDPEWSTQNTALRANLYITVDVDEYADKHGAAQLRWLEQKLGPLPGTPSSTSRGDDSESRQHFYAIPEAVLMYGKPPITGETIDGVLIEKANDVHIEIVQASHRYSVVWPSTNPDAGGAPYYWYDAEGERMELPPHIDDFEMLPQAWIDFLTVDEREYGHQGAQWDGDIPETASAEEDRKLRTIVARLQSLPEVWAPGAGWHDTVFQQAAWLRRISRSDAYAITPDEALQLLLEHTPTYPSWGVDKILEQWESAEKVTAGQYEPPPAEVRPSLLVMPSFPTHRAYPEVDGRPFAATWAYVPHDRQAHRAGLLRLLLDAGVDQLEAITLVWHSAANTMPITFGGRQIQDPHSKITTIEEFWAEVDAVLSPAADAPAPEASVELPPAIVLAPEQSRLQFLTPQERELVAGIEWWGSRMLQWAAQTFAYVNMPYFRMNLWTILSIVFGMSGVLPKKGALDRPLNLYMAIVGLTTSGKSEALRVVKKVLRAFYVVGENPDVGGDFTNESITKVLTERDGQSTWFHMDEAHTKIPSWRKENSPYSRVPGIITEVYDGEVPQFHRNTDKEGSGKDAKAHMTVHLMGTPQGMADVMGPTDWESGFLNRFLWAIGDAPSTDLDALTGGVLSDDELEDDEADDQLPGGEAMYQQWAAEFAKNLNAVARPDGKPNRMGIPRPVLQRHRDFAAKLYAIADRGVYAERLKPTFRRLIESVLRAAALVALSSGRARIELGDLLIAIEFAEEWATNILIMVQQTDETLRTREVNMIERALAERGGVVPLVEIHRLPRFRNRRREVEDMVGELIAQGRADWDNTTTAKMLRLRGVPNAA
ncbi:MAG: hypothetical protein K0S37_761 [Microbacterium sp.]|nr:hypothetical protein [Microbacterium sp.]